MATTPSTVHAQQAVFELSPPRAFSAWRDITYLILRDIGLSSAPGSSERQAQSFLGFLLWPRRWAAPHQKDYRVTIASTRSHSPTRLTTRKLGFLPKSLLYWSTMGYRSGYLTVFVNPGRWIHSMGPMSQSCAHLLYHRQVHTVTSIVICLARNTHQMTFSLLRPTAPRKSFT
jgi:hypothetical protein